MRSPGFLRFFFRRNGKSSSLKLMLALMFFVCIGNWFWSMNQPVSSLLEDLFDSEHVHYTFNDQRDCNKHIEEANLLPEITFIPFDLSIKDYNLEGWEDEWISNASYNANKWGSLKEPKVDIVYGWVNGSEPEFEELRRKYELASKLSLVEGWLQKHSVNRYRDWNELRHSLRSVEKNVGFVNKILVLVNSVPFSSEEEKWKTHRRKQVPKWLRIPKNRKLQVLAQEDFFGEKDKRCLPVFNSLAIESQMHLTNTGVDRYYAMSDDMLFGRPHAASDIYSPLFGSGLGFMTNWFFNQKDMPPLGGKEMSGQEIVSRYSSYFLNRRFGVRYRPVPLHFGHSMSRSLVKESFDTFPRGSWLNTAYRFRGEGHQIYPWYIYFHYTTERHREACLWSYIVLRADEDGDGILNWPEREKILDDIRFGIQTRIPRTRVAKEADAILTSAGLEGPKVNRVIWTSVEGIWMAEREMCTTFNVNCIMPGFKYSNISKTFGVEEIFQRVVLDTVCGDCLIKFATSREQRGLEPILPPKTQPQRRERAVKALMKYQYHVMNPRGLFVMMKTPKQVNRTFEFIREKGMPGQLCINDDVFNATNVVPVAGLLSQFYREILGDKSEYEND